MNPTKTKPIAESRRKRAAVAARKIFLVEDHPVYREGLKQLINREKDLTVCGEAGDYEQALAGIVRLQPDLAVVDITLPGKSGLELIKKLRAGKHRLKLLVVSMHDEALYADRALRAGGNGYIMKQEDPEEIIHAIRDVLGGLIHVSEAVFRSAGPVVAQAAAAPKTSALDQLSDAELELLELLGRGLTNQEIARQLGQEVQTVGAHSTQIRRKLNLKSANALIRYAVCWVESAKA